MKTAIAALSLSLALVPGLAHAGCPQVGGCSATTKIAARLEGAPDCVRIDKVEPENGCVCHGDVTLFNACDFDLVAAYPDPEIGAGGSEIIAPQTGTTFSFTKEAPLGDHQEVLAMEANGTSFSLIVDYTVEYRELEAGCSIASGAGAGGAGAPRLGIGLGLGLAALLLARRRAR